LAYIDWSQQELGIAAALSGDEALRSAYIDGDPYLDFAYRAGLAPAGATKATHAKVREICKACCLGVLYGMGKDALAVSAGVGLPVAADLLRLHRESYPVFWRWRAAAVDHAMLTGQIHATFGWRLHVGADTNPRTIANFPMQANGAEMLRIAACMADEAGVALCGPVHDALLVEAPSSAIAEAVKAGSSSMKDASRLVLDGFALRTEAEVVHYPQRFSDPRGTKTWQTIVELLFELDLEAASKALGVRNPDTYLSGSLTPGPST